MENKNTVIALVLMGVVWFGFSFLFAPEKSVDTAPPAPEQTTVESTAVVTPDAPVVTPAAVVAVSREDQQPARDIVIENDVFRAVLTTSGVRLTSFALTNYREQVAPDSAPVELVSVPSSTILTLATEGSDGWDLAPASAFRCDLDADLLQLSGSEKKTLTCSRVDESGLQIDKIFTFSGDRYDFSLDVVVSNRGEKPRQGNMSLSLAHAWDDKQKSNSFDFIGPMTLVGKDLHEDAAKKLEEAKSYQQPDWSLYSTKYFMTALIPAADAADKVVVSKASGQVINRFTSAYRSLAPGENVKLSYISYFGPRDLDIVKTVNHRLNEAIDFGFFSPLALPLRTVLNFFYGFVGNYGVAIILLTVIIKLLFWPLTQKSYSSMKDMQKLQPEMQKIREKYKKDKERLNQEIMQLYKTKRVNPLGGCLPMIVQIPVFFALYRVLMLDIALRHAPFALWLTDLSVKDPYYITPVIMGGTMFIQQKMTPSSMDPNQAKIFMLMPVIFTFMFLNFPSGLVIYWLVNNLLTILQQYMIHRKAA